MTRFIDLTGERFNKLLVLQKSGNNKHGQKLWLCRCDCGNEKIIVGHSLRTGLTKTCGCTRKGIMIKPIQAAKNQMLARYKKSAKIRNLEFSLSEERFFQLTLQPCAYCGKDPYELEKTSSGNSYIRNGIDRIDNSKGYVEGNVEPCCSRCNTAKHAMTKNEFIDLIICIYKNINNKKEI